MPRWNIDVAHSTAEFSIRHLMISTVKGRFSGIEGYFEGEPEHLQTGNVDVTLDIATVDTRQAERDAHLRSADFFDVEKFPKMTFKSQQISLVGDNRYQVVGDLTIHGVTRSETFDVSFEGRAKDPWGGERAGFSGHTSINRKDYGLQWNVALEAGGVMVGDQVKINVEIEAVRQDG
ncbi:MAG: YceI family protein [Sulfobacillus sp.]